MPIQSTGKLKELLEKCPPNLSIEINFEGKILAIEKLQLHSNPKNNPRVVIKVEDLDKEIDELDEDEDEDEEE